MGEQLSVPIRHTKQSNPRAALRTRLGGLDRLDRESTLRTRYRFTCGNRERRPDTLTWARACVRNPARYGTDERVRQIVASLLAEVTR
jgi:hypothetical protein